MNKDRGLGSGAVRVAGELLITVGIVVLLFVFYLLYVTSWEAAQAQRESDAALDEQWHAPPQLTTATAESDPLARIYIPTLGAQQEYTIHSGVGRAVLEAGPGHYPQTPMPGEPGNFSVAGHRAGYGAPFGDLDALESCDALVIETATDFYVYRVLPLADELDEWDATREARPECANVPSLRPAVDPAGGPYRDTVGRKIVPADRAAAIAPVPYEPPDAVPRIEQAALITLTTGNPHLFDRERLVIHGVLAQQIPKSQVQEGPQQVLEEIGHG